MVNGKVIVEFLTYGSVLFLGVLAMLLTSKEEIEESYWKRFLFFSTIIFSFLVLLVRILPLSPNNYSNMVAIVIFLIVLFFFLPEKRRKLITISLIVGVGLFFFAELMPGFAGSLMNISGGVIFAGSAGFIFGVLAKHHARL